MKLPILSILCLSLLASPLSHAAKAAKAEKTIEVSVTDKGFEPSEIDVAPGTSLTLKITRKTEETCATDIVIPSKKIQKKLPLNETVSVKLGELKKGEVRFSCSMKMLSGTIHIK